MIYLDQDTLTCHPCGKLIWEEMVYEYWILIINELPDHYKNL